MSLMLQWQRKKKVEKGTGGAPKTADKTASGGGGILNKQQFLALLDASLGEDLKTLSDIKSVSAKIERKRTDLIPKYATYVERLRAQGWAHELLTSFMLWLFDIGDMERGLDLGLYCLNAGVPMPERFARDVATVIADEVIGWAEEEQKAGRSPEPYFSTAFGFLDGMNAAEPWDIPDKVTAKFYRLAGMLEEEAGRFEAAEACLERALELGASVKTKLEAVRKALETGTTN